MDEPIRTPARSVANLEIHHTGDHVNEVGRKLVRTLEEQGVRALNPSMGFPMEQDKFPGKIRVVSHKPVAVADGLGMMGIHRNVIHQKFGNFILLGTVLIDHEVYCLSVCPAGEDVIAPYLADKKGHLNEIVKPLKDKEETIYVLKNSDAEEYVAKRFPRKTTKHVGNSLRPSHIKGFLQGVPLVFQPGKSADLSATYHFTFTGEEEQKATIVIANRKVTVEDGHVGTPDLHVIADTKTWIGFLRGEKSIVWAIIRRKVRLKGPLKLLLAFGKCFPQ